MVNQVCDPGVGGEDVSILVHQLHQVLILGQSWISPSIHSTMYVALTEGQKLAGSIRCK